MNEAGDAQIDAPAFSGVLYIEISLRGVIGKALGTALQPRLEDIQNGLGVRDNTRSHLGLATLYPLELGKFKAVYGDT